MPRPIVSIKGLLLCAFLLASCLSLRPDVPVRARSRMEGLPRITLWAWERREDLRGADPDQFAIAYLDQTLTIDLDVHSEARRDAIVFPKKAKLIPVVRIQASRYAVLDAEARERTVQAILNSAREPGISAIQVDFDATLSQREFYRGVLTSLRQRMPAGLPLSITALASWCSWDSWIHELPVDEAVPMFFRMEPDRKRARGPDAFRIREPLCAGSIGVSTRERWPNGVTGKRVYIFPDQGWRGESLSEIARKTE